MKLKCFACDALARMAYACAASSPHIVDIELFQLGLHLKPADLRARLQARIDAVTAADYDGIALAYGLCGRATAGLIARNLPIALPRAHDCITLFLGSRERYNAQFQQCTGTYWYTQDYLERQDQTAGALAGLGAEIGSDRQQVYAEYVAKYGQDNADYLMEAMGAWQSHYERAVFIDMGLSDIARLEAQVQAEAARRGWRFERMTGDLGLLRQLLHGDWDQNLLVLQPGQQLIMTCDDNVMEAANVS